MLITDICSPVGQRIGHVHSSTSNVVLSASFHMIYTEIERHAESESLQVVEPVYINPVC